MIFISCTVNPCEVTVHTQGKKKKKKKGKSGKTQLWIQRKTLNPNAHYEKINIAIDQGIFMYLHKHDFYAASILTTSNKLSQDSKHLRHAS